MSRYGIKAIAHLTVPGRLPSDADSKISVHPVDVGGVPGPELDARLMQMTGKRFRKLGRFIQLAMCGAVEAAKKSKVALAPDRTGIFLASGLGNLSDLLPFSHSIFGDPGFHPSAIQFANSVGNAGAFHIAEALGVTAPVLAVCQDEVCFEAALLQVVTLLDSGDIDLGIVGSVDMVMPPVGDHLARMGYGREEAAARGLKLSEGSAWFVLGRPGPEDVASLEALSLETVEDLSTLVGALGPEGAIALCGQAELAFDGERFKRWDVGTLYTQAALAPCLFLAEPGKPGDTLHVISRTREGLTGRMTVRRA
jgi:Beta-ketoacyl synthase, N-terminal domain